MIEENSRINSSEELEICEEVGRGAFGVVYRGLIKETGEEVAIKQIDLENDQTDLFEVNKEILIISECELPRITRFYGCFVKNYKLWVIMEFVNGGSLFELLKPGPVNDEKTILVIITEVLEALEYLHGQGKIHRDLKSQNILVNKKGEVKLTDFGVSTQLSSNFSRRNTTVGTPYWMAPEVILNHDGGHSYKADIWSLGCCAYELFTGKPPLQSMYPPMKALRIISRCKYDHEFLDIIKLDELEISSSFKEFLLKCFIVDPKERFSSSKLMKQKFITKYKNIQNKDKLLKKLITNKQIWDQQHHAIQPKNFYVPTELARNQLKWNGNEENTKSIHFDISLIVYTPDSKADSSSPGSKRSLVKDKDFQVKNNKLIDSPPVINYHQLEELNTKQSNFKKSLDPELVKISNKVFSKLEAKNSLTTEQYDLLVKLNENIVKLNTFIRFSGNQGQNSTQKLLICQYLKYFLKELAKVPPENSEPNNSKLVLQKLIIPSTFSINRTSNDTTMNSFKRFSKPPNSFDEIEDSLIESWIDKMNQKSNLNYIQDL